MLQLEHQSFCAFCAFGIWILRIGFDTIKWMFLYCTQTSLFLPVATLPDLHYMPTKLTCLCISEISHNPTTSLVSVTLSEQNPPSIWACHSCWVSPNYDRNAMCLRRWRRTKYPVWSENEVADIVIFRFSHQTCTAQSKLQHVGLGEQVEIVFLL